MTHVFLGPFEEIYHHPQQCPTEPGEELITRRKAEDEHDAVACSECFQDEYSDQWHKMKETLVM